MSRRHLRLVLESLERRDLLAVDPFGSTSFDLEPLVDVSNDDVATWVSQGPSHPVFAPGTPQEYIDSVNDAIDLSTAIGDPDTSSPFNIAGRWTTTATDGGGLGQGDPTTLTWSIVPNDTTIPGFNGEPTAPSDLVDFLGGIYGVTTDDSEYTDEPWFPLLQSIVDRWGALSGLTYVYEPNDDGVAFSSVGSASPGILGTRGDVRIGGHFVDGNSGILAYNFFPNNGEMVIDTADNFFSNTNNNSIRLRDVLAHEAGHGIGLLHVESDTDNFLMEPFINTSFDGPQFDEILGVQRLYGDSNESGFNNDTAGATDLGTAPDNTTVSVGTDGTTTRVEFTSSDFVSIDDDSDIDVYTFQLLAGGEVDLVLTPVGPTYSQGPQGGAQTLYDASAQSDLTLELIDSDGATVLVTEDVNGIGQSETITSFVLSSAGQYYARITGSENAIQTYRLDITARTLTAPLISGPPSPTSNDPVDLTIDFFETVIGFEQADIIVTNGSVTNLIDQGSGRYTATVDAVSDGLVDVSIPAGAAVNIDGELTEPSFPFAIVIDTTPPLITAPANINVEATTLGGAGINNPAIVAFLAAATATDNIDLFPTITNNAPALFPVGDTIVTFTATDDAGNDATATATVTVTDTTPPSITLPPDSTLDGDTTGGATIGNAEITAFLARAAGSDIADDSVTVTNDAPAIFPLGDTIVTFTATDDSGNEMIATATMTVEDTTAPTIVVPGNIVIEPVTADGVLDTHPAIVSFLAAVSASDIVDDSLVITDDAPTIFPIGDTVVIFTATDADGNRTSKAATVSVTDLTAPSIIVPAGIAIEGDVQGGASSFNPETAQFLAAATAFDSIDDSVTVTNDAPAMFPVGDTIVTFTAIDDGGNRTSQSATVTVFDTIGPVVVVPLDVVVEANTTGGFLVTDEVIAAWLAEITATDAVQESVTVAYDAPPLFPVGVNAVTITVTDAIGNSTIRSRTITVVDTTVPTVVAPVGIFVEADADAGTARLSQSISEFLAAASAFDIADGLPTIVDDAPVFFPVGETVVSFTASDRSGNIATASSIVTVTEIAGPKISVPDHLRNLTVEGDTTDGAAITNPAIADFLAAVIDTSSADPSVTLTSNAPDLFPLGITYVTFTATDRLGNLDTNFAVVTVTDRTAPAIVAPVDRVIATLSSSGISASDDAIAEFLQAATAIDEVDAAPMITTDAPDLFPLGKTLVTFTATDASGNIASISAMVTVVSSNTQENQSRSNRLDVNGDGLVTARDALNVINELSGNSRELIIGSSPYDVNNDGTISAADALMVINRIPQQNANLSAVPNRSPSEGEAISQQLIVAGSSSTTDPAEKIASFNNAQVVDRVFRTTPVSDSEAERFDWSAVDAAIDQMF